MANRLSELLFLLSPISVSISGYLDVSNGKSPATVNSSTAANTTATPKTGTDSPPEKSALLVILLIIVALIIVIIIIIAVVYVILLKRKKEKENKAIKTNTMPVGSKVSSGAISGGTGPKVATEPLKVAKVKSGQGPIGDKLAPPPTTKVQNSQPTPPAEQTPTSKLNITEHDSSIETSSDSAKELESQKSKSLDSKALEPQTPAVVRKRGYVLGKKIAEGGFSQVYLAEMTKTKETVACKRFDLSKNPQWTERMLKQEMKLNLKLNKMNHKNVIKTYDCIKTRHSAYIFMQFARNGSLSTYMEKQDKPIEESRAKDWFRQIADAIDFLHRNDVAHRDIKPENFLLDNDYKDVLVSDFGFSVTGMIGGKIMRETQCGTPEYQAPEVVRIRLQPGHVYDAKKADMFSLGVSLFEMLNKYKPFPPQLRQDSEPKYIRLIETLSASKKYHYYIQEGVTISAEAKDLIERLLNADPEQRPTADQLLKHPWLK